MRGGCGSKEGHGASMGLADYLFRHGVLPGQLTSIAQETTAQRPPGAAEPCVEGSSLPDRLGEIAALQFLYRVSRVDTVRSLYRAYEGWRVRGRVPGGSRSTHCGGRRGSPRQTGCCGSASGDAPVASSDRRVRRAASPRLAGGTGSPDRRTVRGVRNCEAGQFTTDWSTVQSGRRRLHSWVQSHGDQGPGWRHSEPGEVTDRRASRRRDTQILVRAETDAGIMDYDFSDLAYLPSQWVEAFCAAFSTTHRARLRLASEGCCPRWIRDPTEACS